MQAIQSFLSSAIAINAFAFACDSKIVSPPLGPWRMKLILYSAGFLNTSYEEMISDSGSSNPPVELE